tara:strand:- start:153 stop:278 length:126 start_codon:yes stop_codon:yes gene_type:complete
MIKCDYTEIKSGLWFGWSDLESQRTATKEGKVGVKSIASIN